MLSRSVFSRSLALGGCLWLLSCGSAAQAQDRFALDTIALFEFPGAYATDCWGWTGPDGRHYAFYGLDDGVEVINVSDSALVGFYIYDDVGCVTHDFKTYGSYLYASGECRNDLTVFDLSFLPDSIHFVGTASYNPDLPSPPGSHNISIDTAKGFLYAEGDAGVGRNIHVLDLADPEHPAYVTTFGDKAQNEIHDLFAHNDTLWVADFYDSYSVWDMSVKLDPRLIARWTVQSGAITHSIWPSENRTLAITTEETSGHTIKLWNVADLNNVQLVGQYLGENQLAHNAYIKNGFVYISHYESGFTVLRICATGLEEVAVVDTWFIPGTQFAGSWGTYPFAGDSLLYMSNSDGFFFVFKLREDVSVPITDADLDGVDDGCDLCPGVANPDQSDADGDLVGDLCDTCPFDHYDDLDGDGLCADVDNCPDIDNPLQIDSDNDGVGDACDRCEGFGDSIDSDRDGAPDFCDACPGHDDQYDADNDGVPDDCDNCILTVNIDQADSDGDGLGDACDICPLDPLDDVDSDGFCANVDNCPAIFNINQTDSDFDGIGDECDDCPRDPNNDADGDGSCASEDNCPLTPNADQADSDGDGVGDVCDICEGFDDSVDSDGDGIPDGCDECPSRPDPCTCCNTAGDADNDQTANIADVTFNIARIFSGGPAAACQDEADANGDNSFNIGDVTHLISFIFSGGPGPICGSTGF